MNAPTAAAAKAGESIRDALQRAHRLAGSGRMKDAAIVYRDVLSRDDGAVEALINLGAIEFHLGNSEKAVTLLERAVEKAPDNKQARTNLYAAYERESGRLTAANDLAGAAECYRGMLRLYPHSSAARVNLIESLFRSKSAARLEDFAPDLAGAPRGINILIACMPKSGSSWLLNTLLALTGFSRAAFTFAYLQNEQEMYLPEVAAAASRNTVAQQHCRATAANLQIMQAFSLRPIILVRNLFDALVSMADFYAKGAVANTFFYRDFASLDRATRLDLVVDNLAPWYLQFYASWAIADERNQLPLMWLSFEEMMADKPAAIARIAAHYDIAKSADEIAAALARVEGQKYENRFNKGVAGRGEAELTDEQKARIRRLASYYPSLDFSRIGL